MNKQIIVLAVSSALMASTVMADTVNVNVYGRVRAAVESVNGAGDPTGKNAESQIRLVDNSSVLGFKGVEDLGDGLSALWQAEGSLEADGDSDGRLNSRNTFVGLKGDFGTVLLGQNDTPYKLLKKFVSTGVVEDSTAEISALYGKGVGQNFYTRQKSTIQYLSPNWSGFDFKIGYAPDESKTAATNKAAVSLSASYDHEVFFVNAAYENRADAAGTAPTVDSADALHINAGYKFGKSGSVAVGYETISAASADQDNIYLTTTWKFTDTLSGGLNYAIAGEANDVDETGASMLALGLQYDLSKRTSVQTYFAMIKNDDGAKYNFGDNKLDVGVVPGEDPRVFGLGVAHKF